MILYTHKKTLLRGLVLLILTMLSAYTNGQMEYSIQGKISDESGQAVAYANIVMRQANDSTLIGGTITNESGNFDIKLREYERFLLSATFVGYKSVDTVIWHTKGLKDTLNITLTREHNVLNEVLIKKRRKRAKEQVDMTTYYVNSNIKSASETGVDLISQVPGVSVDLMNSISLNGSNQVIILINGIKRDADYLAQLDAGRIDRIEIRSGGGVQYAASISGVINVILKKEVYKGIRGHVYVNIPTKTDEIFSFPSASLNYSKNNSTWYASYNGSFSNFRIEGINHKILHPGSHPTEIIRTDSLRQNNWSHKVHFGVDHFRNEKTQLSLYGFISTFSNEQDGQFTIEEFSERSDTKSYQMLKDDLDKNNSFYGSVYLNHRFNPSNKLTLEGSSYLIHSDKGLFLSNPEHNIRLISQSEPYKKRIHLRTQFSSMISENVSFESGLEERWYSLQDNLLPSFKYSERIFAAFLQGALRQKSFHFQGSIRAEHSRLIYSDVLDDKRVDLLPRIDLIYSFNNSSSLKINYENRINRPKNYQLNPSPYRIDLFSQEQGNPGLAPEKIRNLSAKYSFSFQENFVSTKLFYRQKRGVIEDLAMLTDSVSLLLKKQNMGQLNYTGVTLSGNVNLHEDFSMSSNIELCHVKTQTNALTESRGVSKQTGLEIRGDMTAIWAIKEDLSLSNSLKFQSPTFGIQRKYWEGALYFISLDKVFFKSMKVEFTSALPFSRTFTYQGYEIKTDDFEVKSEDQIKLSLVSVWLKLKYSFSSGNKVRHLKRDSVFQEKRAKKGF